MHYHVYSVYSNLSFGNPFVYVLLHLKKVIGTFTLLLCKYMGGLPIATHRCSQSYLVD
jgi:hypothetical protein